MNLSVWRNNSVYILAVIACLFIYAFLPLPASALTEWSQCRTEGGTASITAGNTTADITLSTTLADTSKAFMVMNTSGTDAVVNADDGMVTGHILNTSTLRFKRYGSSGQAEVSYTVVECLNDEFSVQHGAIAVGSGASSNTASISSVDTAQSMVIVNSRANDTGASRDTGLFTGHLSNGTTVVAQRAGTPSIAATVRYQVIEFDSSVDVQTGEVTLGTGTSTTDTITSVTTGQSWAYCSFDATDDGLQQTAIGCELTNATTMTFSRYASSSYTNRIRYYVVEFPSNISVQRGSSLSHHPGNADNTQLHHNLSITSVENIVSAFPYTTVAVSGTSTAFPRNEWLSYLTSATNLRTTFWRGASTNTYADNNKYWQVVAFPYSPTPSVSSVTSTTNPTITSSSFGGDAPHSESDWQLVMSADCSGGTVAWESLNDSSNLTSVVVNTTNGTFKGPLSGETEIDEHTRYFACVKHRGAEGESRWSAPYQFGNGWPVASNVSIDSGAGSVVLTPGTTTNTSITATIDDSDGCSEIQSVNATFYRSGVGEEAADDDQNHYSVGCSVVGGSCTGGADTSADYTCTVPVEFFAQPTDASSPYSAENWAATVEAADAQETGPSASDTIEMASVLAVDLTGTVDFGNLPLGGNSGSSNQVIQVENYGNATIDFNITGYGSTPDDGYSFACTNGNVPIGNEKFSSSTFDYNTAGTAMTVSPILVQANLAPSTGTPSTTNVYLGIGLNPNAVGGTCMGTIRINPVLD